MKILVLCADNPSPPITGSRIRQFHLWPILREMGHEVKILALSKNELDFKNNQGPIEFHRFNQESRLCKLLNHILFSFHQWPTSKSLEKRVTELLETWKPDIIHAEELRMGRYIPTICPFPVLKSLCVHNVESVLLKKTLASPFNFARKFFNFIYHYNLTKFEKMTFKKMNLVLTYSLADLGLYKQLYPTVPWSCTSNGVNEIKLSAEELALPEANKILFLGSLNYHPNIEGLFWFLDKIYPQFAGKVELTIAGSNPHPMVQEKIKNYQVKFFNTPLDLKPIYLKNSLLIVPLLNGSGTRGKILESLMYGRPVLTTTIGCEGLELSQSQGLLIADGEQGFSKMLETWLSLDNSSRAKIADQGRSIVYSKYTWNEVAKSLIAEWAKVLN